MKKKLDLLNGNLKEIIIKMTIPIILGNMIQTLYNLTDTYFVSKIGGTQVAAVTFVWPIVFLIISIGQGLSVAGVSLISTSIGRGDEKSVKENIGQLFMVSLVLAVIIAFLGFVSTNKILNILGLDGELLTESRKYMKLILLGVPATFATICHGAVRRSEGDTVRPMVVNVISIIANVILNPIFIFQLKMGITGAAIATLIARYGVMLFCFWDLMLAKVGYRLEFSQLRPKNKKIKEILRIGMPAIISQAMTSVGFILLNVYVKDYGYAVLAAYGIGNRIHSLFFQIALGIGNALSAIVGQNLGNNNEARIKEAFKKSMILSVTTSLLGAVIIQIFLKQLVTIFAKEEDVVINAMNYMGLVSWTIIAWGVFQIIMGYFQGLGDTKKSLNINILRLWGVRIPLVIILSYIGIFREYSVWYSMFYSNILTGLYSIYVYKKYAKEKDNEQNIKKIAYKFIINSKLNRM